MTLSEIWTLFIVTTCPPIWTFRSFSVLPPRMFRFQGLQRAIIKDRCFVTFVSHDLAPALNRMPGEFARMKVLS